MPLKPKKSKKINNNAHMIDGSSCIFFPKDESDQPMEKSKLDSENQSIDGSTKSIKQ
jgi:hypothetical protein